MMRLLLSAFLLILAGLDIANGPTSPTLVAAGLAIGVLLALTLVLDAVWPELARA